MLRRAAGRLFSSFKQPRSVGAEARQQAGEPRPVAAGCEMLHPSLVHRLGRQVEIVEEKTVRYGGGQAIHVLGDGGYFGASDMRRDGQAAGF